MRVLEIKTSIQQRVTTLYSLADTKRVNLNLNSDHSNPDLGYLVTIKSLYKGSVMFFTHPFAVAQKIKRDYSPISNSFYVSGWIEKGDKTFNVELCQWFIDKDKAIEYACNLENDANIWDCENNSEIRL